MFNHYIIFLYNIQYIVFTSCTSFCSTFIHYGSMGTNPTRVSLSILKKTSSSINPILQRV